MRLSRSASRHAHVFSRAVRLALIMRSDSQRTRSERSAPPARIGSRYEVLEQLGHGGTATVYRVRDPRRAGDLALKQLNVSTDAARARDLTAQFEREFYTLAQLSHPSVIEAFDFGLDPNGPYYTMELLDGGDLAARAPIEPLEACRLFAQICSSLCLLHARRLVHRDLSPRNVRMTRDGRAKLIDFGALLEMGPCTQTIGTPAFVAPEVVQHVALDARTDLFSLGATLYYTLTGRPAFHVRSFADLRAAWRVELQPPSAFAAGIPPALDVLVLSLLRIDPNLRPNSAFEVMQRLASIGGIAQPESELTSSAYLTTPRLVGREPQLRRFRAQLRKARSGRGSGLTFEGLPGSGRSRLLDACVLEAKTVGATVLRVSGTAASQPFSGARALAIELLDALPEVALQAAETAGARDPLLMAAGGADTVGIVPLERLQSDRHRTLAALQAWIAAVCREQLLTIAADDVDDLDEASLALLAALAHGAHDTRLFLLLSARNEPSPTAPAALGVLRSHCATTALEPLSQAQLELLFSSVFGNTSHVSALSARIHPLADGCPREALALAQQLLDQGSIRHRDGQWVLPAELSVHDLPSSRQEALRARIAMLRPLALRLAQTQALALGGGWTRADYAELAAGEVEHLDAAIAALHKHGFVASDGQTYTIGQPAHRAALIAQLTASERAECHRRLAELCARSSRPLLLRIHHLLLSGSIGPALDHLTEMLRNDEDRFNLYQRAGVAPHDIATCLENAFALAVQHQRPLRESHELAGLLTSVSSITHTCLHRRYGPAWLARLELDSGLVDYRALAELEAGPRLMTALTRAGARYEATPQAERVYRVDEAIKYLVRYVLMSIVIGARARDLALLASLPDLLEPFASLSTVLRAIWQDTLAVNESAYEGRMNRARSRYIEVLEQLGEVEGDQLRYVVEVRRAIAYALGTIDVTLGNPSLERWLAVMDESPLQQVAAQQLRSVEAVYRGDLDAAERYRKQSELLAVQASATQMLGAPLHLELGARVAVRDLAGVRRVADNIAQIAVTEPGWIARELLAQGWYQRLRGDLPAAIVAFERCFELNDPDRSDPPPCFYTWAFAATGYVSALVDLGRASEAREFGLRVIARCQAQEVTLPEAVECEVALADAALGNHDAAAARLDTLIARHDGAADHRLLAAYEARARVAIMASDRTAAVRFATLATQDPHSAHGHTVQQRHGRMLDDARRAGLDLALPQTGFESSVLGSGPSEERNAGAIEALRAVQLLAPAAKPQRILDLICEAARGSAGQLYVAEGERLSLVASRGAAAEPALTVFASRYFRQQLEDSMETSALTAIDSGVPDEPRVGSWTSPGGNPYRLIAFTYPVDGEPAFAGLVALELPANRAVPPQTQVLARALARELATCVG
jgi:tetratricopeptide (TPR) repeat protein